MRTFICWLSPSPGYEQHGKLHVESTNLHFVTERFIGAKPECLAKLNPVAVLMTEDKLEPFLRHDAEEWSHFKTGHDSRPEIYRADHAEKLLAAYKQRLADTGELNFTIPCAGVKV
jgi:hypothetical protein